MQNRYVGDIGDFGKYALLRAIASPAQRRTIKLGVVWCHYPDEDHNSDGKHVSYLRQGEMRLLDPELFDHLHKLVERDRRSIDEIARSDLFDATRTVFVNQTCCLARQNGRLPNPAARKAYRADWVRRALNETVDCNLVFFDPDNGVASDRMSVTDPKAGKFIFLDEVKLFAERSHSLVIYHHADRTPTNILIDRLRSRIRQVVANSADIIPLVYHRGSCRVFFIVAIEAHKESLKRRIKSFMDAGWNKHFSIG